jgi:hypothetical protein
MKSRYYGLADCHGVESFSVDLEQGVSALLMDEEFNKDASGKKIMLSLRANANAQRHAVVYRVLLEDSVADEIEKMMSGGQYEAALLKIKENAEELELGTYGTTLSAAEKNWKMIPNPDLDPYHS